MHRIFRVKAYEMEHGPHFVVDLLAISDINKNQF